MQTNNAVTPARTAPARLFSRKIGNTTFLVSVAFSEKSAESIEDKIIRLAASEPYEREVIEKCV